jgi:DNA-binding MarR family transcriptional regulator
MPALQQMVDGGLIERVPSQDQGVEKLLRITPKGRQELAQLRPYLVRLTDLIDGEPQPEQRSASARPPSNDRPNGARAALMAIVRESETSTARLRAAMQQMKNVVDAALSAE